MRGENEQGHRCTSDGSVGQHGEMGLPLILNNLEVKHSLVTKKELE